MAISARRPKRIAKIARANWMGQPTAAQFARRGQGRLFRRRTPEHLVDYWLRNVSHGRFERSLSALTAFSALITTIEVWFEHYRASFGDPWMWTPVIVTPPVVVSGILGVFSKRIAKTWLPITAGLYALDGLVGEYFHIRGIARRPGGWSLPTYNITMGPPLIAPGLFGMVGCMGILAAILRRED